MKGLLYRGGKLVRRPLTLVMGALGLSMLGAAPAHAQTNISMNFENGNWGTGMVSNNFEYPNQTIRLATNNTGVFNDGTKQFLSVNNANNSTWAGRYDTTISRNLVINTVAGHRYRLGFDLFLGMSVDGYGKNGVPDAGSPQGPDWFGVTANGTDLLKTTFSNFTTTERQTAGYGQAYNRNTPITAVNSNANLGGTDADVIVTGTDLNSANDGNDRYSIYRFQNAPTSLTGNKAFEFIGTGSNMTLTWRSFQALAGNGWSGSNDEYWSLDNINVTDIDATVAPEPGSMALLGTGVLPLLGLVARRRKKK